MSEQKYSVGEIHQLVVKAISSHNTSVENANDVADALVAAEIDGQGGHGLSRLPSYCAQALSGKVKGKVAPVASQVGAAAVHIDAKYGFAYPAMDLAIKKLVEITPECGIAVAAVNHSHHCGAAGYHVEKLAEKGLVGLLFANTPEAIAPWGGKKGVFGTNPIAFAVPRKDKAPMVIDLALSKVARGKIMVANRDNKPIPEGWALDSDGQPTTDPSAALSGTMIPMGDAKGAALVLLVEILAAGLTASNFGFEASSFFEAEGDSPGVGQLVLAIAPSPLSGDQFHERIETLFEAILSQDNTRLPGERKIKLRENTARDGLVLPVAQYEQLQRLASGPQQ